MTRQRPYPSDLSDARWELIGPTLTAWRVERRGKGLDIGRPPEHDLRRIMDAILSGSGASSGAAFRVGGRSRGSARGERGVPGTGVG